MIQSENYMKEIDALAEAMLKVEKKGIQVTLEMLLLNYLFNEDDGKLSKAEKKVLKKHFSLYKNRISIDARKDIIEIQKSITTLKDISVFLYKNKIPRDLLEESLSTISKIGNSDEYNSIIKDIKLFLYSIQSK